MTDLYFKNYQILMKESKENTNTWKGTCVHGLEEYCSNVPITKATYRFMKSIKIPMVFFTEIEKEQS